MKNVFTLAANQTTAGAGQSVVSLAASNLPFKTFQSYGTTSSGTGSATITIEASMDGTVWFSLGAVSLTLGTTVTGNQLTYGFPWGMYRANVSAITGTGAKVTVLMAV